LQQLEPAGIGARNLQECLMLQTERDHAAPDIAYLLLEESFDDLVNRQWDGISQKYAVSFQEIQTVFDYIPTLTRSTRRSLRSNTCTIYQTRFRSNG
jgi:RNA polymerase sigma-54 factor